MSGEASWKSNAITTPCTGSSCRAAARSRSCGSPSTTRTLGGRPLHICGHCHAPLVQPLSWSETGDEHWELELICPNCEWTTTGIYSQAEVEELEDRLEEGLSEMLADLQRLAQANMSEEIDRFVTALCGDMILPEDF